MSARIVLNALALERGGSGVQTYCREILAALPGAALGAEFAAVVQRSAVGEVPAGVGVVVRDDCSGLARTWESLKSLGPADLVHGLDVDIPARRRAATVTTVHDLAVFDVPDAFSRVRSVGKRLTTGRALRRADAVIAVSTFTAERIQARTGRTAVVIPEAVPSDCRAASKAEVADIRARLGLPDAFVVYAGNLEPRKDVSTLADACRRADVPLVLAGAHIATVAVPAGARHIGHVSRADIPALFGAATVVAYVSNYEGFGLPPFEALACGATVMATPVGAIKEHAGDAVALVRVGDAEGQAATLRDLFGDPARRAELVGRGADAIAKLSWTRTAAQTVGVYASLGIDMGAGSSPASS